MGTPIESLAVAMPIKSFDTAKARLGDVLAAPQRAALARHCADVVLAAAAPLPLYVICSDNAVADWARERGARIVTPPREGLNEAARAASRALADAGFARMLLVHSDLPHAESLASLGEVDVDVVVVPDRHHDGTNALLVPTALDFGFGYGQGSFTRHCVEATRLGLRLAVIERADLALDIDTQDDLSLSRLNTQP